MPRISNNASLYNGAQGAEARTPTSYSIEGIFLTDHTGQNEYDIQALVTDFSITESIYRPALSLSMNVKDMVNFMSQARISGHEKIRVKLSRKKYTDETGTAEPKTVDLTFYTTEYPVYGKSNNLVQAYSVRAVTKHGYVTKLKKISRHFNGTIAEIVKSIAVQDLGIKDTDLVLSEKSTGQIYGIFPNMEPLDAIHWILRRAYCEDGSPFYFYQALDGKVYLQAQTDLVQKSTYKEYVEAKFFQSDPSSVEMYDEMASRILSMNSELNLAKVYQANKGAYASKSVYVDISQKRINMVDFDYLASVERMPTVEGYPMLSDKFVPEDNQTLNKYASSKINYIPTNEYSISGGYNYNSTTLTGAINKAGAYLETLDSIQHDVTLAGDFELNCGKIVSLRIPPPIDPNTQKKGYTVPEDNPTEDPFLSGGYLVTSVQHNFSEEYFTEIRVKRDSLYNNMFE